MRVGEGIKTEMAHLNYDLHTTVLTMMMAILLLRSSPVLFRMRGMQCKICDKTWLNALHRVCNDGIHVYNF